MRRRKAEEEKRASLIPSLAKQNTSGSGELVPNEDDEDELSSETSVSNCSIFDPPIE